MYHEAFPPGHLSFGGSVEAEQHNFTCGLCGAGFISLNPRALFCEPCRPKARKIRQDKFHQKRKRKQDAAKLKGSAVTTLPEIVPEVLLVLKECALLFAPGHVISRFDWGASFLRGQDIRELNELPLKLNAVIKKIEECNDYTSH